MKHRTLQTSSWLAAALAVLALAAAGAAAGRPSFVLTSPVFKNGAPIPKIYTCGHGDLSNPLSPPLRWTAPPPGTRAFAITVQDTDTEGHDSLWLGWGIRASARGLAAGQHPPHEEPNVVGYARYDGPCPQATGVSGVHRYRFRLYALNADVGPSAFGVLPRAHVLAVATTVGTYK